MGKASVTGRYVEEPGDLEPALAGAIASDEPILLHVRVARTEEYPY